MYPQHNFINPTNQTIMFQAMKPMINVGNVKMSKESTPATRVKVASIFNIEKKKMMQNDDPCKIG